MFKFLMFIFLIGLFGFLFVGMLLGRVIRFFGGAPNNKAKSNQRKSKNKSQYSGSSNASPKKFSKNEGEYVDYEEVLDDK